MGKTVEAKCFRLWIQLLKNAPTSVLLLLKGQSGYVFDNLFHCLYFINKCPLSETFFRC